MERSILLKKVLPGLILLHFALYAVSPVYLTIFPSHPHSAKQDGTDNSRMSFGMVWLRTVLTVATGVDPDDLDSDGKTEGYNFLVDGDHIVSVGKIRIKPFLFNQHHILPVEAEKPNLALHYDYYGDTDFCRHEPGGFPSLNTGLSPPSLLS